MSRNQKKIDLEKWLFHYIDQKNLSEVKDVLLHLQNIDLNIDLNEIFDPFGRTPLIAAIDAEDVEVIKAITKQQSSASVAKLIPVMYSEGRIDTSATENAIIRNQVEVIDFFIQRGCINIKSNDLPKITDITNDSIKHLVKTRELYSLLHDDKQLLKLENIESLVNDGAVINQQLFEVYRERLLFNTSPSDKLSAEKISDIKKITRYFIERGVKVNNKVNNRTFLQEAVDEIIFNHKNTKIIDANSTHFAIALLQNSSGFNLNDAQKTNLIKGVLKHDPEYIKTLVSNGWIKLDFVIEDLKLDKYAAKVGVSADIIQVIVKNPAPEDRINEKKRQALTTYLLLENKNNTPEHLKKLLTNELVGGVNTSGAVTFTTIGEDGRAKKFLDKVQDGVPQQFGNEMLRVLSNKQYGIKRGALSRGADGNPYFVTKWDDSIAGNYFLEESDAPTQDQDKEFVKNYARLCGVIQVLGEHDHNPKNFLRSDKTGRPVKIDNAPLVNGFLADKPHRIYGSTQSNVFLHFLAGEIAENSINKSLLLIGKVNKAIAVYRTDGNKEKLAKAYIDVYNEGINDTLLSKIKANIKKNPNSKEVFIEFMAGIKDSINLANDKTFLEQYTKKYQDEIGDSSYEIAKKCREFLQTNAKEAQKQFKNYLVYYATIAPERNLKSAIKITTTTEEEVMKSIEKMLANGEVNSKEDVDKFIRKSNNVIKDRNQVFNLFTKIVEVANKEVVAYLYDKIILLHPDFITAALAAPVNLFPTKINEAKYIEIIGVLRDKGCIPANSYLNNNGKTLKRSIFADCKNERAYELLKSQFNLSEQIVGEDETRLFEMIALGNVEVVNAKIQIFQNKGINFNGVFNQDGFTPISEAAMLGDLDVVKALVQETPPSDIVRELHLSSPKSLSLSNPKSSSSLGRLLQYSDSTEVINYFLEQGYYNLDNIEQYTAQDKETESDGYKTLMDTAVLKDLISDQEELGTFSISAINDCANANLKALVRDFKIDAATENVTSASEGKSFLQIYVENLSRETEAVKANEINTREVIKLLVEKGLDVNSSIKKDNQSSSLLQHTLDSINLKAKSINFENTFIAIALIDNNAKFTNLTNQQKSKLVRGIAKHEPKYLKNLFTKGVIDQNFIVEKIENGVMKKIPIKTYVAELRDRVPKEIHEMLAVIKPAVVTPSVIGAQKMLYPVPARAASATVPTRAASATVPARAASATVPARAVVTPPPPSVKAQVVNTTPTKALDAQTILDRAYDFAVRARMMNGDSKTIVLANFTSACQKISKFQEEQKSRGKDISNDVVIAALWPSSINSRPQTPKPAQLNERERNILSTVALFCDEKTKSVSEGGFQKDESKKQVLTNLEKLGTAAITEWINKKTPLPSLPSKAPIPCQVTKLDYGGQQKNLILVYCLIIF